MEKETYEAPAMETLGSFETLTQSTNTGTKVDANFQNTTPSILGSLS